MRPAFRLPWPVRLAVRAGRWVPALSLVAPMPGPAVAQTELGAQVRPRFESRTGAESELVSMRTRASIRHAFGGGLFFVELQDVRLWGEEASTLGDFAADALDLHQGFIQVGEEGWWVRAGRQEIALDGERLVGRVAWAQHGRSFDGVRALGSLGEVRGQLLAMQLAEAASATGEGDLALVGGHVAWGDESLGLSAHSLVDGGEGDWRWTHGARAVGVASGWSWRLEGSVQGGVLAGEGGEDVRAWMAGVRVGRSLESVVVTLWYDHLSGDDDPLDETVEVFNTLFATNHKFYGYADLFTEIPAHTADRGLRDAALKLTGVLEGVRIELAAHSFSAAATGGLQSARFGEELDLVAGRPLRDGVELSAGASWVRSGPALGQLRGIESDRWFGYLMLDARF